MNVRLAGIALAAGLAFLAQGCAETPRPLPSETTTAAPSAPILRDGPRDHTRDVAVDAGGTEPASPGVTYFAGTGRFFKASQTRIPNVQVAAGEGFTLNFTETDIRTVIAAVLGDILDVPYFIDPSVQGTLSLQTSDKIGRGDLLTLFETVLRVQNFAIVDVSGTLHVVPIAQAPRRVTAMRVPSPASRDLPGFGVQIVPLRFTNAVEMRQLLEPFAPPGGIVRVDEARSLLIIAGTRQELATMLQTIETFDVDWMAGMSTAMFHLNYVEAETLAKELLQIFADADSPIVGMTRLIPIPRLNAILAISSQKKYLEDMEQWVRRLDLGGASPGRRIYVYHVENGRATDLASSLNAILGDDIASETEEPGYRQATDRERPTQAQAGQTRQEQTAPAAEPESVLAQGGLRIVPDEENNALLILATPSEFGVIEAALIQMDVAPRQVLIEASLVEVALTDELRHGVQWFFQPGENTIALSESGAASPASQFPGFSYVFTGVSNVRLVLNALESVTKINVLFSPKLMVLNNQSAVLQVGDQVPVPVQSSVSVADPDAPIVNSIQFRDTGVILTVTPRINEGGLVLLDIEQEVSDVVETTTSGIDAPTIQQRRIASSVAVQDSDTIVLGGLIRETVTNGKTGVPFLRRVPLFGNAFGSRNKTLRRTELIAIITPRVVNDARSTREVMDYLRDKFQTLPPIDGLHQSKPRHES